MRIRDSDPKNDLFTIKTVDNLISNQQKST